MKKISLLILLTLALVSCNKSKPKFDINLVEYSPQSHFTADTAKLDIEQNEVKIIFLGGFGGIPDFKNKKDSLFQIKYNVSFYSEGCMRSSSDEDLLMYNETIFNYLDSSFGKEWVKEIRDGAIGFK